jgi:hypothetical protein
MLNRKSKCQFLEARTIVYQMLLGKTIDAKAENPYQWPKLVMRRYHGACN